MRRLNNTLQLRLVLGLFFLLLAVPSVIIVREAYSQLKWEAFYQYRNLAEELSLRINNRFSQIVSAEETRAFADYSFLVVSGTPEANYLQPSPLSRFPVAADIPGLMGYFQLNAQGHFSTPLLPQPALQASNYGVSATQIAQRQELQQQIQAILSDNQLVQSGPPVGYEAPGLAASPAPAVSRDRAAEVPGRQGVEPSIEESEAGAADAIAELVLAEAVPQPGGREYRKGLEQDTPAGFSGLKDEKFREQQREKMGSLSDYGRVEDLNLGSRYDDEQRQANAPLAKAKKRDVRKEQSALPVVQALPESPLDDGDGTLTGTEGSAGIKITMFESEIDPL